MPNLLLFCFDSLEKLELMKPATPFPAPEGAIHYFESYFGMNIFGEDQEYIFNFYLQKTYKCLFLIIFFIFL